MTIRSMLRRWLPRLALGIVVVLGFLLLWVLTYRPPVYPPPTPVALASTNIPLAVSPGLGGVLFVLPDGSLWRWGHAGLPTSRAAVPERIGADSDWRQATPGNNGFVGVKRDGTLWQAGLIAGAGLHGSRPRQLGTDTNWAFATKVDVAAAALKTDGTLWTWGNSMGIGSLGDPAIGSRADPGQVGTNRWRSITGAGSNYGFVGITQEGELRSWGRPRQPGPRHDEVPSPIHPATQWTHANLNQFLDASGNLWFGPVEWGIAGTNSLAPILTNAVPGRFGTALAKLYEIRSDGTLWSRPLPFVGPWPRKIKEAPAQIGERTDWLELWSAGSTCVGLTRDGTVWVWGTDWGAEPRLDILSRIRRGLHDGVNFVSDSLGLGRLVRGLTTSGRHRVEETPRALLQMTPVHGGP